ncbi:phosphoribosylaminoimidazolesuccinocarboxamide synthase [Conexibacter sp. DBS9H8]|uniref:phosphoribosylaminoimidazolesuccinocarboxamide synthase n=1 Tax=Conexibacter sp. DBS9H8 TaxID=2937801 RepID=UPI00200EC741|nr:phosphoribosylaminoimidazolesuccinocarboxamide synthase [Conexibacter sp. DBS9H8]
MSALSDLPLLSAGKVRDVYDLSDRLLLVATDRISTYDVVHPTPIPGKGAVLTGLTAFWLERAGAIVPHHLLSVLDGVPDAVRGRAMVVKKLAMLPVEAVVRGYLSGSGWRDYQATGQVSGIALPAGMEESDRLPEPIFTPSTKAAAGHDEAIDFGAAAALIGSADLAAQLRERALELYRLAAGHAAQRGIILADTKFEFGLDADGVLTLADEVCTPDSSRFWPAAEYAPGRPQASFDKQYVRDWATATGWDKRPPAPAIPADIVAATAARYQEAWVRLTDTPFSDWLTATRADPARVGLGAPGAETASVVPDRFNHPDSPEA